MPRFAWLCLLIAFTLNGEDITVRVISAKDGHPFTGEVVQMVVSRAPHEPDRTSPVLFHQKLKTDGEGQVVFRDVNFPASPFNTFFVATQSHPQCSPYRYSASILRMGAAEENCPHRPKDKFGLPVRPGEVVLYLGEYSRLEGMLYFPWWRG